MSSICYKLTPSSSARLPEAPGILGNVDVNWAPNTLMFIIATLMPIAGAKITYAFHHLK